MYLHSEGTVCSDGQIQNRTLAAQCEAFYMHHWSLRHGRDLVKSCLSLTPTDTPISPRIKSLDSFACLCCSAIRFYFNPQVFILGKCHSLFCFVFFCCSLSLYFLKWQIEYQLRRKWNTIYCVCIYRVLYMVNKQPKFCFLVIVGMQSYFNFYCRYSSLLDSCSILFHIDGLVRKKIIFIITLLFKMTCLIVHTHNFIYLVFLK